MERDNILIMTKEDLDLFKKEVLNEIRASNQLIQEAKFNYMRSKDVMTEFKISSSQLQNWRIGGTIPYTKIGDTYLYPRNEIKNVLNRNANIR